MIRWLLFTLTAPLFFALGAEVEWWNKPEYQSKIREQRQVIVVIKQDESLGKGYYSMTGAGTLKATPEFTIAEILDFGQLQKISSYFKKVVNQPQYDRVYFLLEAYGYEARLLLKYKVRKEGSKTIFHWDVVWGGFQGMVGEIELSSLKADKSEAILRAKFNDKEIPLPSIFKSFILEIIVQQVAKSIRSFVEEQNVLLKGRVPPPPVPGEFAPSAPPTQAKEGQTKEPDEGRKK